MSAKSKSKSNHKMTPAERGRLGGLKSASNHDADWRRNRALKAGMMCKAKYGNDFYRYIKVELVKHPSGPKTKKSILGPLRNVVKVLKPGRGIPNPNSHNIHNTDRVLLECGHEANRTNGSIRARCKVCALQPKPSELIVDNIIPIQVN